MSNNTQTANRKKKIIKLVSNTGGWVVVLLRIIRGGVLSGSPNPDPF